MLIQLNTRLIQTLVLAVCLNCFSCAKEGGLSPRLIVGEWELVRVDGSNASYYNICWEFEKNGDFKFCYDGDCYSGSWEWEKGKEELDLEYVDGYGDKYSFDFEVDVLDKNTLEGDGYYNYLWEFERKE